MNHTRSRLKSSALRPPVLLFPVLLAMSVVLAAGGPAFAQGAAPDAALEGASDGALEGASDAASGAAPGTASDGAEEPTGDLQEPQNEASDTPEAWSTDDDTAQQNAEEDSGASGARQQPKSINLLELMLWGGWLMVPIAAMSLVVVAFGAERLLGLRRRKVVPRNLIEGLKTMVAPQQQAFDPHQADKLCQRYPSAASRVIRAVLLKLGRPLAELEHTMNEANQREATRLYANVRWLSLAAGVSPLLGLLGTVWGMIKAFFTTAYLPTGANKTTSLAEGIYTALVTTFAGLAVAIPAAVLAHFFEGRIQKLLHELEESLLGLLPRLERFRRQPRKSQDQAARPEARPAARAAAHEAVPERPAATQN
jgi:biopolymer transport protein ExbB